MPKIEEAQEILKALGLPKAQQNDMAALTLIALCGLKPKDAWKDARREASTVTKSIMDFLKEYYGKPYAPNTRETFRRQVLHQFVQAHVAEYNSFEPSLPTNSPRAHYAVSEAALKVIKKYGTVGWNDAATAFLKEHGSLSEIYAHRRGGKLVPVTLPGGTTLKLSPGKHNEVQKAIIEEFAPRFAQGAKPLYLGDTAKKNLHIDADGLAKLGIPMTEHDKLPDVVLYDTKRKWLFLIEAVTSHGPMSPKRIFELQKMLKGCKSGCVYVSAFPDATEFKKHVKDIAWDTEVWLADVPEHLIHFNGDRFFGPRD
jgi:hypothetical protein